MNRFVDVRNEINEIQNIVRNPFATFNRLEKLKNLVENMALDYRYKRITEKELFDGYRESGKELPNLPMGSGLRRRAEGVVED